MSRWFRHYAGMMRDEKLVRAAVASKQPVERVVWIWGALLESAAEINDGGKYELDAGEVAYFLRCETDDVDVILACLESLGRIVEGSIARWGDRQFDSDASRERQRRYRERRANASSSECDGDVELPESDVTPPSPDAAVTLQEDRDRDRDRKKDSEPNGSGAAAPVETLDPKTILFDRGLTELSRLTDRPPAQLRSVLGRWLKLTANDAGAILAEIEKCRGSPVADPIAWIERQLKPQERTNANTADSQHERNRRALANILAKRTHAGGDAVVSAAFAGARQPPAVSYLEPGERPAGDARLRTG